MYPTSTAYQTAVCAPVRTDRVTGTLTLTDGTVLPLTDADLVSGSLCWDNQCVNGEELAFGCAYLGQVSLQLRTELSRYALYGAKYTAMVANKADRPADFPCTLAGRCCESGYVIGENIALTRPERGDKVAVLTTGAYNYSMASNYNRFGRPAVVMVCQGEDRLVVRRETLEDLTRCDV